MRDGWPATAGFDSVAAQLVVPPRTATTTIAAVRRVVFVIAFPRL